MYKSLALYDVQDWDGADRTNHTFFTESKEFAEQYKAYSVHSMFLEKTIHIVNSFEELSAFHADKKLRAIKAKLTNEELAFLGLTR